MNVIAEHNTRRGFAIAIIEKGGKFLTVRIAQMNELGKGQRRYIVLHQSPTEFHARQMANKEWLSDMGRPFDN